MDVESGPQGREAHPQGQAEPASLPAAPPGPPVIAGRRIFICYSRRVLAEVSEFETTLRDCLQSLDANYTVFRDVTRTEDQSIKVGDDWRATLNAELDRCVCCVVVLIPAIFDRPECVYEIERFQKRVSGGEKCFFFPIVFLPVADEFTRRRNEGHPIALLLGDRQHYDFTESWSETQPKVYKRKVLEVAQRIHQRVREMERPAGTTTLVGGRPMLATSVGLPAPAVGWRPAPWWAAVAALLAITVVAAVWFKDIRAWFWPVQTTQVREPAAAPVVTWVALPPGTRLANATNTRLAAYARPDRASEHVMDIAPGQTIPPSGSGQTLEQAMIRQESWLRFPIGSSNKFGHVPAASVTLLPAS